MHICVHMYVLMIICIHNHICKYVHIFYILNICECKCIPMPICDHIYVQCMPMSVYSHAYAQTSMAICVYSTDMNIHVHTCGHMYLWVDVYTHVHLCTSMNTCDHIHMCMPVYAYEHVCIRVCLHRLI